MDTPGQNQYNTGREVFAELKGIEFYRTTGFKEIAIIYGDTEKSYRKTTQLINRIRHQEQEGTPSRTLHESTEREGTDLLDHIGEKSKYILEENGFSKDGICQESKTEYANDQPVIMAEKEVAVAIETCRENCDFPDDILNNPVAYEDPEEEKGSSLCLTLIDKFLL